MSRLPRLLAGAGLLLVVAPSIALAHTELVSSDPADRTVHGAVPDTIVLTFSGELLPDGSGFEVTGPDGTVVGTGTLDLEVADRNVLSGTLVADAAGAYVIAWRSAAVDGHEAEGELTFSVESSTKPPDTALPPPAVEPSILAGGVLLVLGAALVARRRLVRLGAIAISAISAIVLAGCIPGAAACPSAAPVIDVMVTATSMSPSDPDACRGQDVTLRVAAEADGVFHIHGYDEAVPATTVAAGETTDISFTADRAGQFPIEFHAQDDPAGVEIGILTINEP
jgi:methionine-rich copper-binding protein CopC